MPAPENRLKQKLRARQTSIGAWLNLGSGPVAEMAAGAGFDWCVIDGEHGPFDVTVIRDQLIALRAGGCDAVVRVPTDARWVIKQVLDLGAQSILVPMVDTADQARAVVAATRYPPNGTRGVGASVARASGYGAYTDYARTADSQIAVIVQVETREALRNIDAIAAVDGVDAVFIGPADLAADMGYLGQNTAPAVTEAIDQAIKRIHAAGKASGFIGMAPDNWAWAAARDVTFMAVTCDLVALANTLRHQAQQARETMGITSR